MALFPLLASGQSTHISGAAPDYASELVLVMAQTDGLSTQLKMLASTETDSVGNFELALNIDRVTRLSITINHISGVMFVQPDKDYTVFFPALPEDEVHTFGQTAQVSLIFMDLATDDLNAQVSEVNFQVDSFLVAHVDLIGSRQFAQALLKFEGELAESLPTDHNSFLQQHLQYSFAITAFHSRTFTRLDLYKRFLANATLEPHPTFFNFLRTYFQQYFNRFESNYGTQQVLPALKSGAPGDSILSLMKKDDLLQNDTLREYVAIHALMESFNDGLPRKKVVGALEFIGKNGQTAFIREAAINAIDLLTNTTVGFMAENLTFKNQYNEEVSLSDFRGKYLYLEFFSTWCTECPREQSALSDIAKEYKEVAEVVSIVVDSEQKEYQSYLQKHPGYSWNILFDPTGYQSIQAYNLRALPAYFLINADGVIIESPALTPTSGIVERLYPLLQKLKESKKFKVGE